MVTWTSCVMAINGVKKRFFVSVTDIKQADGPVQIGI